MPIVPRYQELRVGTQVSIVLKADQKSGKRTIGTIQTILTSGDHPRGIKVCLSTGQIGRVQEVVNPGITSTITSADYVIPSSSNESRFTGRYRDIRLDSQLEQPDSEIDLFAYVKPAKVKRNKQKQDENNTKDAPFSDSQADDTDNVEAMTGDIKVITNEHDGIVKCPVCNEFSGDEMAVSYHVQKHFDQT